MKIFTKRKVRMMDENGEDVFKRDSLGIYTYIYIFFYSYFINESIGI